MGRKPKRPAPAPPPPAEPAVRELRPARWLIGLLLVAVAAALIVRLQFERRPRGAASGAPADLAAEVRAALRLDRVLAAEEALRGSGGTSSQLAGVYEEAQDPVGAALALFPARLESPEQGARYARSCLRAGWLEEAERVLNLDAPPDLMVELAAAQAQHGRRDLARNWLWGAAGATPKPRADDWLNGAMTWVQLREPGEAVEWARRGPWSASPAARLLLARCFLAGRRAAEALEVLPATSPGDDSVTAYWRARAELQSASPETRRAGRDRMDRLAAEQPENGAAAFDAGRAWLKSSEPRRAIPLLSRAAAAPYQDVLCWDLLSRAHAATGQPAAAAWMRGRWLVVRGHYEEACGVLRRAVRLDPKAAGLRLDLVRALMSVGRGGAELREALKELDEAQRLVDPSGPERVDVELLRASVHFQSEDIQHQHQALRTAAELPHPRSAAALLQLGTEYHRSHQYDRAIEVLEQALRQEETAHAQLYLGLCRAQDAEHPASAAAAARHLLRAAALQPEEPLAWSTLASVLLRLGHRPEARACLRQAIRRDPDLAVPYLTLRRELQAAGLEPLARLLVREYERRKDREQQRAAVQLRADRQAANPEARFAYGELLLREGRPEKALKELLVAASLRPGWREARERLSDVCALLDYPDLQREAELTLSARGGSSPRE